MLSTEIEKLNNFLKQKIMENEDLKNKFDTVIDNLAFVGNIDHLQNITHPFFVNKHMDNLLFIKDNFENND